jgi:PEP-CTERM motif
MTLYFTDGIDGETHGLFAAIAVPEPSTWVMMLVGFGGLALFAARRRTSLAIG